MHRPIYTSSTAGVSPTSVLRVAEDLQQALEPVFALYQARSLTANLRKWGACSLGMCVVLRLQKPCSTSNQQGQAYSEHTVFKLIFFAQPSEIPENCA